MEHSFDIEIAQEYGIECAIILKNLYFWIEKNRVCDKHFYDGRYWTYGSIKAFCELFPYIGEKKMRNAFQKLEDCGLLITGNYNKSQYDRTKWYALTNKGISVIKKEEIDSAKGQMSFGERANENDQKGEPIPDITTDIEPDINTVSNDTVCRTDVQRCINAWNSLADCGIKPVKRIKSGTKRYDSLCARIREYGVDDVLSAIEKIRHSKFLQGKSGGKRQWNIRFDWFVLPNNFPKVLEGNYDDDETHMDADNTPPESSNGIWGGMRQ